MTNQSRQSRQEQARPGECVNVLTHAHSLGIVSFVARFKDILKGLSAQTRRKQDFVAAAQDELVRLLEARQRYEEVSAWVGPESESVRIGWALLFAAPMKTSAEKDAYAGGRSESEEWERRQSDEGIDPATLDLRQYPLWKIIREVLRQVPEMRVCELHDHLKQFGIETSRSALESCLKTHRKQFRVTLRGREKFVAWKEEYGTPPATTGTRK